MKRIQAAVKKAGVFIVLGYSERDATERPFTQRRRLSRPMERLFSIAANLSLLVESEPYGAKVKPNR